MYLYLFFIILALTTILEIEKISIKYNPLFYKKTYWFFILIFFLLSSLRWGNGTDWESYYLFYTYHIGEKDIFIGNMEPGFTLMTSFNSIFNNYSIQLASVALLSIIPIALRIRNYSIFPLFSLFIWYCTSLAGIFSVRQNIAIAIFVFSWKFIEEKRIKEYILLIFIASTFHISSLIVLPIYYFWHKRITLNTNILVIIIFCCFSFILGEILSKFMMLIGGEFIRTKLEVYLGNSDQNFNSAYTIQQVIYRGIINRSFIFFPLLFLLRKERIINNRLNAFFNLYTYSFILFLLFTPLSMALGRLCMFTDIVQIFIIPYLFKLKSTRISKFLIIIFLIFYLLIRLNGIIYNYKDAYIPYKFVFFA